MTEIDRLKDAIRRHRDQRGDDRCWLDDLELYSVLGEKLDIDGLTLPPRCEFLESCERFWHQRQPDARQTDDPEKMTIRELVNEVNRLRGKT